MTCTVNSRKISAALGNSATIINLPQLGKFAHPRFIQGHISPKVGHQVNFIDIRKNTFRFPKFAIDFRLLTIVSSAHIRQKTIGAKPEVGIAFLRVEWNTAWATPFEIRLVNNLNKYIIQCVIDVRQQE